MVPFTPFVCGEGRRRQGLVAGLGLTYTDYVTGTVLTARGPGFPLRAHAERDSGSTGRRARALFLIATGWRAWADHVVAAPSRSWVAPWRDAARWHDPHGFSAG